MGVSVGARMDTAARVVTRSYIGARIPGGSGSRFLHVHRTKLCQFSSLRLRLCLRLCSALGSVLLCSRLASALLAFVSSRLASALLTNPTLLVSLRLGLSLIAGDLNIWRSRSKTCG